MLEVLLMYKGRAVWIYDLKTEVFFSKMLAKLFKK